MGDTATAAAWLGVAATVAVGIYGSSPFQKWLDSRREQAEPITLGDLSDAKPLHSGPSPFRDADLATYKHLIEILPTDGIIEFLRDHNFGYAYRQDYLDPLDIYLMESQRPDMEFLSERLESKRKDFLKAAHAFQWLIAQETFSSRTRSGFFGVPDEWEMEQSARYFKAIEDLNAASSDVVRKYNELVRAARKELLL